VSGRGIYTFPGPVDVPETATAAPAELKWVPRKAICRAKTKRGKILAAAAHSCGVGKNLKWQRTEKIRRPPCGSAAVKGGACSAPSSAAPAIGYVWQKGEISRLGRQIPTARSVSPSCRTTTSGWPARSPSCIRR